MLSSILPCSPHSPLHLFFLSFFSCRVEKSLIWLTHDKDKICYVGEGVRYNSGELTILQKGKYYVYSQITFSTIDNEMPHGQSELLLVFSIQRKPRHETQQTLLLSKMTMEPNKEENDSVSGIIQLNEGDVLSVYISHPSLLKNILAANFFGLYKL